MSIDWEGMDDRALAAFRPDCKTDWCLCSCGSPAVLSCLHALCTLPSPWLSILACATGLGNWQDFSFHSPGSVVRASASWLLPCCLGSQWNCITCCPANHWTPLYSAVLFSSVQKGPCALHPVFLKFLQGCLWNGFQRRSGSPWPAHVLKREIVKHVQGGSRRGAWTHNSPLGMEF